MAKYRAAKYRVAKCRHKNCYCAEYGLLNRPWQVVRQRGLERSYVSYWPGQASALQSALEYAGLANPLDQRTLSGESR